MTYMFNLMHLLADVCENFRDKCIETYELDPSHFLSATGLAWKACLKKTSIELELSTDPDVLLTFEDGTRGEMCNAIHRYAKANNKCIKNYNKNVESSYLQYQDANNLYGWAMSKILPVGEFELINPEDYTEDIIKRYDENDDYGAILIADVDYPKKLYKLHSDLPFLSERMKINKVDKLICNTQNKRNYVVHIAVLKQALDHGLIFKKVHKVIKFKQEAWLKSYIDMNTDLRKESKNEFEKGFFKLMNNSVFGKTMENVRNHRDIKLVTSDKRRSILASEPNYHSSKCISKDLMIISRSSNIRY